MTRKPLSLLHVVPSLARRYGGPPRIAECCAALAALGNHVELVSTTLDGPDDLDIAPGVPIERDGYVATAFPVPSLRGWAFSPSLARWLWRNVSRFDVVHVHGVYGFTTVAAARACRHRAVPYIMQPHGALTTYHRRHHWLRKRPYEWLIERSSMRAAAAIRWESERERQEGVEAGWPHGILVPSGVWLPDMPEETKRRSNVIAFLGRLSKKKGIDIVVEAFARVAADRPDVELRIAGPDQDVRAVSLKRRAEDLGLGHRVRFEGLVDGPAKDRLFHEASVFALPSADESFGAVAVEAMAHCAPVVITTGTPFHADLKLADAALVCDRNPQALADALLRILEDRELAERLGRNGRSFVSTNFRWEVVATSLNVAYHKLVADRSPLARRLATGVEAA